MSPLKYNTEEERIQAQRSQKNCYAAKDWKCDVCDIKIRLGNKKNHLNTRKHIMATVGSVKM